MKVEGLEIHETGSDEVPSADGGAGKVFFCVAVTSRDKKRMAYFHSYGSKDAEAARALAVLCLEQAPANHWWHHHTVAGRRTFGFLTDDDGRTYFAVADPTPGGAEMISFLECVRDAHNAAPKKRLIDEALAPVVRRFVSALETAARTLPGASPAALPYAVGVGGERDEEAQFAGPHEGEGRLPPASRRQLSARSAWWRLSAFIMVVDVVLCLFLLAVWLGVCHGFRCVSR